MQKTAIDLAPMTAALARRVADRLEPQPSPGHLGQLGTDGILDLSTEYGPGALPRNVIRAVIQSLDEGETHYTTRSGLPALVQAVAHKLKAEQGFTVDPATEEMPGLKLQWPDPKVITLVAVALLLAKVVVWVVRRVIDRHFL